ncbi:hypothetical protein N499_0928B, partial [Wolbachia pipientis wVitA]
ASVS